MSRLRVAHYAHANDVTDKSVGLNLCILVTEVLKYTKDRDVSSSGGSAAPTHVVAVGGDETGLVRLVLRGGEFTKQLLATTCVTADLWYLLVISF
jgi:hypothetical protein